MPETRTVGITGANGYVGSVLVKRFRDAGWRIVALQRSTPADPGLEHRTYNLEDRPDPSLLAGLDALVHCAYDLQLRDPDEIRRVNLHGTERLFEAAREAGVASLILISSMSAYESTTQIYGRTKVACEHLTTQLGGTSLRLGLVYGGPGGGMSGALTKLARLPLVPVLRPSSYQYLVHADDMADCVLSIAGERPGTVRIIGVANERQVPFDDVMRGLRLDATHSRRFPKVPVPWRLLATLLALAELVGLRLPFRADSLSGLMRPARSVPGTGVWRERRIALRDWPIQQIDSGPQGKAS